MIPEQLVEFLHGPMGLILGTRDARLRPCVTFVSGVKADAANDEITMYLADVYGERPLQNLADNGMVALTCGHGPAHETFQFKGEFVESRPSSDQGIAVQELYKAKVSAHYDREYGPEARDLFDGLVLSPSTAVRFKVSEIFDQTPGPNAGARVEF